MYVFPLLPGLVIEFNPLLVDATISFPSGLSISWQGKPIGQVDMSDVDVVGVVGATIDAQSTFHVVDVDHLTDFTKVFVSLAHTIPRPLILSAVGIAHRRVI